MTKIRPLERRASDKHASDKHASLLRKFVNYGLKNFYRIGLWYALETIFFVQTSLNEIIHFLEYS